MSSLLRKLSLVFALTLLLALPASANVEDFNGVPPGTVVSGDLPQGGAANSATFFPNVEVVTVTNNNGPNSAIIFDSANPTGGDTDLGTPNQTCPGGGPGVGSGGEVGQPGENCEPLGHVVIIAENIADANGDNIVDDPDDEISGGSLTFEFHPGVIAATVTLLDIDSETSSRR